MLAMLTNQYVEPKPAAEAMNKIKAKYLVSESGKSSTRKVMHQNIMAHTT